MTWMQFGREDRYLLVCTESPTAIMRRSGDVDRVVSWPDLNIGQQHVSTRLFASSLGVWVVYRPEESLTPATPPRGGAVHLGWDGTLLQVEDIGNRRPAGATSEGLLLITAALPDPADVAAWYEDPDAVYLTVDGARRSVISDRRVVGAHEDETGMHHLLFAGPPVTTSEHGGTSYSYPLVEGDLTTGDDVRPLRLHARSEKAESSALAAFEAAGAPRPIAAPVLAMIPWTVISLSDHDARLATQAVVDEFLDPDAYWHADDGTTTPLATGLAEARVDVFGQWPDTRVEVSFTHPHYQDGRMRRVLAVFDDAGRINSHVYASIHLMEDLDTRALPDPATAQDGILTI